MRKHVITAVTLCGRPRANSWRDDRLVSDLPTACLPKRATWQVAVCVLLFSVNAANAEPAPPAADNGQLTFRTWNDRAGKRTAIAALVELQGKKLLLRRPNGKLATTALANLSLADQQYVKL